MSNPFVCPRSGAPCEALLYCESVKTQIEETGVPSNDRLTREISWPVADAGASSYCVDDRIVAVSRIAAMQASSETIVKDASFALAYIAQLKLLRKVFSLYATDQAISGNSLTQVV